ncbi:MAG TPA: cobyrinic acid a,c-diamide synthase [Actinocrinis sp.]|nr:cobyrinic acid a,c-diamide synthase [Actinocrinis sp.]
MPGADELFRPTGPNGMSGPALTSVGSTVLAPRLGERQGSERLRAVPDPVDVEEESGGDARAGGARDDDAAGAEQQPRPGRARTAARSARSGAQRGATGRERHDEKITVYVSPEELLGLEQARITLRAEHGLAVDRGRIVREAIDLVLADLEANGEQSLLVRTLREH